MRCVRVTTLVNLDHVTEKKVSQAHISGIEITPNYLWIINPRVVDDGIEETGREVINTNGPDDPSSLSFV